MEELNNSIPHHDSSYFKLLNEKPAFSVDAPTFGEPLKRSGFTAVEVSEIVE